MNVQNQLHQRVALVTGVSRPDGIGLAVARRLHALGATVVASGWPPHDSEMEWGTAPTPAVAFPIERRNLENPSEPAALIDEVVDRHGQIDIVVAAHARSSMRPLAEIDADELDRCWAVNVRSIVLLSQRFAFHRRATVAPDEEAPHRPSGRMLWFTSGQHLAPMEDEIAYAISKGALHQMTGSIARALSRYGIVANCINPGPVDTGWANADVHETITDRFPDRRWTSPDDTANLVAFLVSDAGSVVRGQVLDAESGFDRF